MSLNIKATKNDIGRGLYPVDNSYVRNLSVDINVNKNPKIPCLAGNIWQPPKLVEIVSGPYIDVASGHGIECYECEFVNVQYEGDVYRVLNTFSQVCRTPIGRSDLLFK
jgi:hypothetical protein